NKNVFRDMEESKKEEHEKRAEIRA
ncbi:hypothetical protein C804_00628, partial [Lachnospiraceae bacterium A4]